MPLVRRFIHRHMRASAYDEGKFPPMSKPTVIAFCIAVVCGFWLLFKAVEPEWLPVVEDFQIVEAEVVEPNTVSIRGTLKKVRSCEFVEIVGYSGNQFVVVIFAEYAGAETKTRIERKQTYGPWRLVPKVPHIELFATHQCFTGRVTTKLFEGAIVL